MSQHPSRLLFLYTGGTIGMLPTEHGLAPGADLAGWLAALMTADFPEVQHELVTLDPLVDSSSATPASWQRVLDAIEQHGSGSDGVVVLHGTDTLAFTSALLDHALGNQSGRVVLTGAMRSLVVRDGDAEPNVTGAVRAVLDERWQGVGLWFGDLLLEGRQATKVSAENEHAFESMNAAPIAQLVGGQLVFPPSSREPRPALEGRRPLREVDLAVVSMHPGLRPQRLRAQLSPAPEAVVLRGYGPGNVPDDADLLAPVAEAVAAGSVLVLTTQCAHGRAELGGYAVAQGVAALRPATGGGLPVESLIALVTLLLSQGLTRDEVLEGVARAAGTVPPTVSPA